MLTTKRGRSDGIALTKSLLIAVRRRLAENRALLDKKRTAGFLDSRPAMRYNIHRKGTVTNGVASFEGFGFLKTVTLAEVAVLLFDPNRERKSKDMERQSNRHLLTSFRK